MTVSVPSLDLAGVPSEETQSVYALQRCLSDLRYYIEAFAAARKLFGFSTSLTNHNLRTLTGRQGTPEQEESFQAIARWRVIAAREGALSIYHFAMCIDGAVDMRECPTFRQKVDHRSLRTTRKLFTVRFPNAFSIRHAVAHASELGRNPRQMEQHGFSGKFDDLGLSLNADSVLVRDHISGSKFANSFDGKILVYEINQLTLDHLKDIATRAYSAFPAKAKTR